MNIPSQTFSGLFRSTWPFPNHVHLSPQDTNRERTNRCSGSPISPWKIHFPHFHVSLFLSRRNIEKSARFRPNWPRQKRAPETAFYCDFTGHSVLYDNLVSVFIQDRIQVAVLRIATKNDLRRRCSQRWRRAREPLFKVQPLFRPQRTGQSLGKHLRDQRRGSD